jgi:lipoprotein-anchoring transpeptidase ErfK/SrfK
MADVANQSSDAVVSPDSADPFAGTQLSDTQAGSDTQMSAPLAPAAPLSTGKVIVVSRARQWLYAYQDGRLIFANAVETGRPQLPTPAGHFRVQWKARNITFRSPWPKGSPYYYYPTHINYALLFKAGGFYLHDAWWHVKFGPGGNVSHKLANGTWETGSHGCVGMPIPAAQRLYNWAWVGTPVIVQ